MTHAPRVTVGIPTYNRDTYLAEAVQSCLDQDFDSFEVLVVIDGSVNPRIDEVLAGFDDPRLRVVRHEQNRGIAAAMNTIMREARGELIATLGDDDVNAPGRLRRQVEVFDRHPDTGVVHGDAVIIDEQGRERGLWKSRDFSRHGLVRSLFREHNWLVDTSTMRHRKVFEAIGPCDETLPWEDFSFHVRAARLFRYRHVGGEPLVRYRRHGGNESDEGDQTREIELVERVLEAALGEYELEQLVPELDWAVLDASAAERRALHVLADAFEKRGLPLPGLAARVRARTDAIPAPPRPKQNGRKIVITSFGYNDSGGGTTVPRLASKELARRGWDVTVFHAAVKPTESKQPYEVREWEEDGVKLVGVHNRPHALFDLGNPWREVDDPPITKAYAELLDRVEPDIVHYHNLHNMGAALLDETSSRGIPSFFTTHNYWLICPRAYLLKANGEMCAGPGDRGADCASCAGSTDKLGYERRLSEIRGRFTRGVGVTMAVSDAVRNTLVAQGYPAEAIDVVRQGMPAAERIWERLGRDRAPGRQGERLVLGFFGSAYWHKGPQLLIEAAQRASSDVAVQIHGEVPEKFRRQLEALDTAGIVEFSGHFGADDLPGLLAGVDVAVTPSMWWDCAPLMAAECLAGRVPVLAPRLGGIPEWVRDDVDGLLFDGLDADDLARKIDRLATEPGIVERLQSAIEAPRPFSEYVDELEAYYAGARPSAEASDTPLAVRWLGDHDKPTSLSIINQRVTAEIEASDPGVVIERVNRAGQRIQRPLPHAAEVEVRHQWPPDFRPASSGRLAVIQPWEFGAIPQDWVEPIRSNVDELWVPSEFVRRMYLESGIDAERVHVVPNGVDTSLFAPEGPRMELDAPGLRLLFVGGVIGRKGPDVLLDAYTRAFAGRDDVTLVIKDFGAGGLYKDGGDRDELRAWSEEGRLPRIVYMHDELSDEEMASLYRACDVLVHPYRGEGFGMPVLEAMACGLPVVVTGGGPTDEFCPAEAGWRIRSERRPVAGGRVGGLEMAGEAWMLEPDGAHLASLLSEIAAAPREELAARGKAGTEAAAEYAWDRVAAVYAARLRAVASRIPLIARPPRPALEIEEDVAVRVVAAPAWKKQHRVEELLAAWVSAAPAGTSACLYLLADLEVDGDADFITTTVMDAAAAAGVDLEAAADITILAPPLGAVGDDLLHEAMDAYVDLNPGTPGHVRLAKRVLEPTAESLRTLFERELRAAA